MRGSRGRQSGSSNYKEISLRLVVNCAPAVTLRWRSIFCICSIIMVRILFLWYFQPLYNGGSFKRLSRLMIWIQNYHLNLCDTSAMLLFHIFHNFLTMLTFSNRRVSSSEWKRSNHMKSHKKANIKKNTHNSWAFILFHFSHCIILPWPNLLLIFVFVFLREILAPSV